MVVSRVSIAGRGTETADINILIYDAISRRRGSQAYFEVWDIGGRYQTRHSVSYFGMTMVIPLMGLKNKNYIIFLLHEHLLKVKTIFVPIFSFVILKP